MHFDTPDPKPDPLLEAQDKRQQQVDLASIQKQTTSSTDILSRIYGSSAALAGSKMKAPLLGL